MKRPLAPVRPACAEEDQLHKLEWLNFFLADIQTGVGPFLAAYLAASHWSADRVGYILTFGGLVAVALQAPAGLLIDALRQKRGLVAAGVMAVASGALLLAWKPTVPVVACAQLLIGGAGAFLLPAVAAITMGMVSVGRFDGQFGRNQRYNSAGNVFAALLMATLAYTLGNRAIFVGAAVLALPTLACLFAIDGRQIDFVRARGGREPSGRSASATSETSGFSGLSQVLSDRVLLGFFACAFLFHLANAAMLPELGEMLAQGNLKAAAPFMSACVIVTQLVIMVSAVLVANQAQQRGRKPLLVIGFALLPLRGLLYAITHHPGALIAIQLLDGVANAIFGIVSVLLVADRTRGTGRFNFAQGMLGGVVGVGAALSTSLGGLMIKHFGYSSSFAALGAIAGAATVLLCLAVPETKLQPRRPLLGDAALRPRF